MGCSRSGIFHPKYFRRGGKKKREFFKLFCFFSFPFYVDSLQFLDCIFAFLFFLCMNTWTENKCLCLCLFSHLLYCWLNRKCNLDICRCSHFEVISRSFLYGSWHPLNFKHMWYILKNIWKIYCCYFPVKKWELIHLKQISGYSILINSSR